MTPHDGAPTGPDASATRWLDEEEMAAWLPLLRVVQLLPQAMDRQLRQEAGIGHAYYQVLATLSAQPERTLSMGSPGSPPPAPRGSATPSPRWRSAAG